MIPAGWNLATGESGGSVVFSPSQPPPKTQHSSFLYFYSSWRDATVSNRKSPPSPLACFCSPILLPPHLAHSSRGSPSRGILSKYLSSLASTCLSFMLGRAYRLRIQTGRFLPPELEGTFVSPGYSQNVPIGIHIIYQVIILWSSNHQRSPVSLRGWPYMSSSSWCCEHVHMVRTTWAVETS